MSAMHDAARRLAGLLNDSQAGGVSIDSAGGEAGEGDVYAFSVSDGKLTIIVNQLRSGKWVVEDQ